MQILIPTLAAPWWLIRGRNNITPKTRNAWTCERNLYTNTLPPTEKTKHRVKIDVSFLLKQIFHPRPTNPCRPNAMKIFEHDVCTSVCVGRNTFWNFQWNVKSSWHARVESKIVKWKMRDVYSKCSKHWHWMFNSPTQCIATILTFNKHSCIERPVISARISQLVSNLINNWATKFQTHVAQYRSYEC